MALYTNFANVQTRLIGKVSFTEDATDENKMQIKLANALINEAEGQVELDLSPRYMAPFQTDDQQAFKFLPVRPTTQVLQTLAELQAVMRILETDFGRGTATDGDNYSKMLAKRYDQMKDQLLAKKRDGNVDSQGWRYPPLPGLRLAYFNTEADDGYAGSVIVASGSQSHGYPNHQINNPAENFFNGFPPGWNPWLGRNGGCE